MAGVDVLPERDFLPKARMVSAERVAMVMVLVPIGVGLALWASAEASRRPFFSKGVQRRRRE